MKIVINYNNRKFLKVSNDAIYFNVAVQKIFLWL